MRKAFVASLTEVARRDSRIVLLTGDLGFNALEPFKEEFPERFFNVGVSEQNMIALATGLAEGGFIPFCYSIVCFATLRPYEFIRNGPILHQLPVRIVGMGGGVDYSTNGATHYGIEDVGVLRVQPGISIYAPADSSQVKAVIEQTADSPGPIYYRLGKNDDASVLGLNGCFTKGIPEHVVKGRDVLVVAMGGIAVEAAGAVSDLRAAGINAGFAVVSSLNPVDTAHYATLLRGYAAVVTVEAHYVGGGLGSLTAETIAENGVNIRLVRRGLTKTPNGITGSLPFMYDLLGISRSHIVDSASKAVMA